MAKHIQYIKMAQRALNMDDDDYRAMLLRVTGNTSSKQLTATQVAAVKAEFKRLGYNPDAQYETQIKAMKFLWMQLGKAGQLRDASINGMWAFVNSNKSINSRSQRYNNCIQALKDWCQRENVDTGKL